MGIDGSFQLNDIKIKRFWFYDIVNIVIDIPTIWY